MTTCTISLNSLEKVKRFVTEISKAEDQFDLISGNSRVDAASVLGILSLDLTKPLELRGTSENSKIPTSVLDFVTA